MSQRNGDLVTASRNPHPNASPALSSAAASPDPSRHVPLSESVRYLRHSPSSSSNTHHIPPPSPELPGTVPNSSLQSSPPPKSPPAVDGRSKASFNQYSQRFSRPLLSSVSSDDLRRASPKERLNALLASPPSSNPPTAALPSPPPIPPSFIASANNSRTSAGAQSRNVSSPIPRPANKLTPSPMAAATETATALRNPSVDSTPSSVQTNDIATSQTPAGGPPPSPVPSPDSPASAGLDAAALIAKAGSAEAAVEKLLKEKQSTATRSDQLWKLVEKQRAMILGLNKDLERALQDKERYRKKVKEYQANRETSSKRTGRSEDKTPSSPTSKEATSLAGTASVPEPSKIAPTQQAVGGSSLPRSSESDAGSHALQSTPPRKSKTSTDESSPQQRLSPMDRNTHVPKLSISTRRAAPAPLDLSASATSATTPQFRTLSGGILDEAEVPSEDASKVAESPVVDRGRRKTREDDDRLREKMAIEEEERRSKSNKSKKESSKSKSRGATEKAAGAEGAPVADANDTDSHPTASRSVGLPTSPRGPILGGLQSPLLQAGIGSIATTLNPPTIPQSATHSAIPPHMLSQKSPGLPMSPRPGDRPVNAPTPRMPKTTIASPGLPTPRSGLPFSPRAPTKPIPLPPMTPLAMQSPHLARAEHYHQRQQSQTAIIETMPDEETPRAEQTQFFYHRPSKSTEIYKGFVSDQYPNLLLPPNALPLIDVKVYSSRLRPSRNSIIGPNKLEEDPIFTLAVHSRADGQQLWRVEKSVSALLTFDQSIKAESDMFARLPDRSLFAGHAPAKIDARRTALMQYFDDLLNTQMNDNAATTVCSFFSSDVIAPHAEQSYAPQETDSGIAVSSSPELKRRTEGYLGKKGKQFGGWKARYFIIDGSDLRYYEAPGGPHLGNIRLTNAQIAKQNAKESEEDAEFRHAFMILEPKRRDSTSLVRHVLCAESDEERDSWVEALMQRVDGNDNSEKNTSTSVLTANLSKSSSNASQNEPRTTSPQVQQSAPQLQAMSYDDTVAAEAPVLGTTRTSIDSPQDDEPSPSANTSTSNHPNISGPLSGGPIQNVSAWGNKQPSSPNLSRDREKETKKSKMFGFMSRTSEDGQKVPHPFPNAALPPGRRKGPIRPVFGMPLAEAAEVCPPIGINLCLPSPVYRCIEYLQGRNALKEEGIFRQSGSNVIIKALKERFNTEGDVKLLGGQYYDIHAVASLLKLYLRELPDSVLTRELHLDFLKVLEIDEKQQKINAANFLIHKLPEPNLELLNTLSRFLIDIVNNSDINKMTVRNVGIVFAPTLNIPAPLLSLLLGEYKAIFHEIIDPSTVPSLITESNSSSQSSSRLGHQTASSSSSNNSPTMDDLRSPRKQMFTELTTPAPDQTSFPGFQPMAMRNNQSLQQYSSNAYVDPRMAYDTGFVPVQRQPQPVPPQPKSPVTQVPDPSGYSSLNAILSPGPTSSFPTISSPKPQYSTQPAPSSLAAPIPPPAPTPSPGPPPGYNNTATTRTGTNQHKSSPSSASTYSNSSSPAGTPNPNGLSDAERRKQRRESAMLGNGVGGYHSHNLSNSSTGLGVSGVGNSSGGTGSLDEGRKSSLQRLREATGSANGGIYMEGVREEA